MRPTPRLDAVRDRLDALLAARDAASRLDHDPLGLVHAFRDPADQEVAGLVAALLAFGNVKAIRASITRVFAILGAHPAAAIDARSEPALRDALDGFVHRVYRGEHVARLLTNAATLRRGHGSLGAPLALALTRGASLQEALAVLADALRGPDAPRGLQHLVPDPRAGSACKRLLLYLRWMVRRSDGVDLGVWPEVDPSVLVIPVDTHVHRIAQNLGLTRRRDASWRTAEEITAHLRRFDPADPVKYDFAICHLGVSRECPSRRDAVQCERCVLRPVCVRWTRPARVARRLLPSSLG